jgi:hypothetical protein
MINNNAKQAGQTTRDLAVKIAKQMAQEPLEVLKTAGEQVAGKEFSEQSERQPSNQADDQNKLLEQQTKLQDMTKSGRRVEALQREVEDIRKQNIFKDLLAKINQGIEVPLEDYPELSAEQKQVLSAQTEAVRVQMVNKQMTNDKLITPISKRGRRFGAGQKQEAEKQQTHVEKPVPPSG